MIPIENIQMFCATELHHYGIRERQDVRLHNIGIVTSAETCERFEDTTVRTFFVLVAPLKKTFLLINASRGGVGHKGDCKILDLLVEDIKRVNFDVDTNKVKMWP